jgi:hypothetical protein
VVAIVSLVVAVGTILMADVSDTSILGSLLDAVRALW